MLLISQLYISIPMKGIMNGSIAQRSQPVQFLANFSLPVL